MKLADYLYVHGLTPRDLRRRLGLRSRTTVQRYLSGERVPSGSILKAIDELTEGAVTRQDFLDPRPARCVRVVVDRRGELQLVYPWTVLEHRRQPGTNDNGAASPLSQATQFNATALPPPDAWPSPPLERALLVLGGRAKLARRGGFLLDGRKADSKRVVAAANETLKERGMEPIPYPGLESKE